MFMCIFRSWLAALVLAAYLSSLGAPEFVKAIEYVKEHIKLITRGTTVKHIWSDAFKTYLSAHVTALRMTTGINISVLPSYLHSYNPCENLIRNASRGCRKALENLVGLECPAGTIIDRDTATEWWDTSYESWMQTYNLSPNDAVERMFAAGGCSMQSVAGGLTDAASCSLF